VKDTAFGRGKGIIFEDKDNLPSPEKVSFFGIHSRRKAPHREMETGNRSKKARKKNSIY